MTNKKENQPNRTQLTDLPVAEQEMTAEEMAQVQGGGTTTTTMPSPPPPPAPAASTTNTSTKGNTSTQGTTFGG